ncbi:hypothetical protein [Paenibacillus lautus]|nr:hypothetical protein [Paenibacillus lautus]
MRRWFIIHHEIDDAKIWNGVLLRKFGGNLIPYLSVDNYMRLGKLG